MSHQATRHRAEVAGIGSLAPAGPLKQVLLRGLETGAAEQAAGRRGRKIWIDRLRDALAGQSSRAHQLAEEGLQAWPTDPEMLMLAALTCLAGHRPERAQALLKR
jgi:hypothetical protein